MWAPLSDRHESQASCQQREDSDAFALCPVESWIVVTWFMTGSLSQETHYVNGELVHSSGRVR